MRPVDKSLFQGNKANYQPYGDAKDDLISALGGFCSYCERQGFRSALAVEHIKDKNSHPEFESDWDNFLLSCTHCNSIKGRKTVADTLLPDRDNTFDVFIYLESGFIKEWELNNLCIITCFFVRLPSYSNGRIARLRNCCYTMEDGQKSKL